MPVSRWISEIESGSHTGIDFAVSKSFYEPHEREIFEGVFAQFEGLYEELLGQAVAHFDPPEFEGTWDQPGFPEDVEAHRAAVWSLPERWALTLQHEDTECPILLLFERLE
jgi:hypothetical protein